MAMLLEACIKARLNIVISGGTGCGKTTLLNTLSSSSQRRAHRDHRGRGGTALQHRSRGPAGTRPANIEGKGSILTRDLVRTPCACGRNASSSRSAAGPETLDMLPGHEHWPLRVR